MKKHFYYHLINLDDLNDHFDEVGLSEPEKQDLLEIIHKTVHLEVMNYILKNVPADVTDDFLAQLEQKPADRGHLIFVKRLISDFESEAKNIVERVKQDFVQELQDYRDASQEWLEGV